MPILNYKYDSQQDEEYRVLYNEEKARKIVNREIYYAKLYKLQLCDVLQLMNRQPN